MDTAVATAISTGLGTFADDALSNFATVIPLALGVTITVAVAFMVVRAFRAIAHV